MAKRLKLCVRCTHFPSHLIHVNAQQSTQHVNNTTRCFKSAYLCAKKFHSWWTFDKVLTKIIFHSFFETRCTYARVTAAAATMDVMKFKSNGFRQITHISTIQQISRLVYIRCECKFHHSVTRCLVYTRN